MVIDVGTGKLTGHRPADGRLADRADVGHPARRPTEAGRPVEWSDVGHLARRPTEAGRPVEWSDVGHLARVARLIGESSRAAMLDALMSGEALTAGELARLAGVSAATASEHLARLRDGGLIEVVIAGRHRYHRLASPEVAATLEALSLLGPSRPRVTSLRQARAVEAMQLARTCYDHLAGRAGVAVHEALVGAGHLVAGGDGYLLSPAGAALLGGLGVDVAAAGAARRHFATACLDFTERRPHLAGALGAALCRRLLDAGWLVRRVPGQRALRLTDSGRAGLATALGIDFDPGR